VTLRPPRLAQFLMARSLSKSDRDAMLGDLSEEFTTRAFSSGAREARRWYVRQVRRSIGPNVRRRVTDLLFRRPIGAPNRRGLSSVEALMTDLRDAVRSLRATPGLTIVALVVLTLGIGATTAIFSVVDAVVLRPLPFDEPDRLVAVGERTTPRKSLPGGKAAAPLPGPDMSRDPEALVRVQPQNYLDWVAQQQVFESIAAFADNGAFTLRVPDAPPEDLVVQQVTASFFDVLRVRPLLGRSFTAENEVDGRDRVAILSDALWRSHFGGNRDIIGRTIPINDGNYEVLGVMPPDVTYPVAAVRSTDLFVPYVVPANQRVRGRGVSLYLQVIARLTPGVSIAQAQAQMDQVASAIEQANPVWAKHLKTGVRPLRDHLVGASTRSWMLMLLGAVGIVLLIACANVANLLLARSSGREREMAVRAALGAGRSRLVRQLMVESLVLSITGTLLSVVLAWWAIHVLRGAMPEDVARVGAIGLNLRVLVAAAGLALGTGFLFGVIPALQLSKTGLTNSLKDSTRAASAGRGRQRLRSVLVVAEVALAVVLVVGAALFIGSFIALMRVDPGFNPDHVLTVDVWPRAQPDQRPPDRAQSFNDIVDRIGHLPGVVHSSMIANGMPLGVRMRIDRLVVPGRTIDGDDSVSVKVVTHDYHRALQIPVRSGRYFGPSEYRGGANAMIINESTARTFFAGEDAVGHVARIDKKDWTIVGVIGDVHHSSLETAPRTEVYLPMSQSEANSGQLVIQTRDDPYTVLPLVKAAVFAVLPDVPVRDVKTMEELVARRTAQRRLSMLMLSLLGLLGLVISAAGIYGVLAYVVSQRTREIGVRMALGATRSRVVAMVLLNACVLVAVGLAIGGVGARYLGSTARTFLFGLQPSDPRAFAAALLTLSIAALIASVIPAHRAATVDPIVALRAE
jgi:putative ABC transport system permease protein